MASLIIMNVEKIQVKDPKKEATVDNLQILSCTVIDEMEKGNKK